jgi:hypothetical protein
MSCTDAYADSSDDQLEQELLQIIPPWEEQHDMPFLFDDSRITDILHDEMESRQAERNAKMVRRIVITLILVTDVIH